MYQHEDKNKFFWVGPQKSASTWAYRCFKEHPEIFVPKEDATHYYSIKYYKGKEWYKKFFKGVEGEKIIGETTPSYIRSRVTTKRIAEEHPDAKIIMCLRNPIKRAFSHYWHVKKKGKIDFEFKKVFENYNLFKNWVETGFYDVHIKRFRNYFPEKNIKITFLEELKENDKKFIQDIFSFLNIKEDFEPSLLNKTVNKAGFKRDPAYKTLSFIKSILAKTKVLKLIKPIKNTNTFQSVKNKFLTKKEYKKGPNKEDKEKLKKIFKPHMKKLNEIVEKDVSNWY